MYHTPRYNSEALPLDQPVQFFQYFTMLHNTIFIAWARILLSFAASRSSHLVARLKMHVTSSLLIHIFMWMVLKKKYEIGRTISCKN
jgi:hypothetical protein